MTAMTKSFTQTNLLYDHKVFIHDFLTDCLILDIVEERLKLAKQLGATHTLLTSSSDVDTVVQEIHATMGEMPDITIECSGNNFCQRLAIMVCCMNHRTLSVATVYTIVPILYKLPINVSSCVLFST